MPKIAADAASPQAVWWRLPIVWLVIGGPLAVVVASFATLALAILNPDPVISGRARAEYEAFDAKRREFRALTLAMRQKLKHLYQPSEDKTADTALSAAKSAIKTEAMRQFRADYEAMKSRFNDPPERWAGYDAWVAKANNAAFGAQGAYDDLVEAFERLFAREGRDWQRFYDAVKRLAALPSTERQQHFKHLMEAPRV